MSALPVGGPGPRLDRLDEPKTIDDVLRTLDQIIEWCKEAQSGIGYFAVLYRRITLAIREAIISNVFDNGRVIGDLDVAFATRYFNALNAYFYPDEFDGPTLPWQVAFVGDQDRQALILQHMLAGLNAHITYDLGLALLKVAGQSMRDLKPDYDRVNVILCDQVPDILKVVDKLSPEIRWTRYLIPGEISLLKRSVTRLRRGAWLFAFYMATHPENAEPRSLHQEAWTSALSSWYLQPSGWIKLLPWVVRFIGEHESRDVAYNLTQLDVVSKTPQKSDKIR
ncbi:hypothetical protein MRAB57_1007 [Mycobacterium rhizamassiliense]|jgi:hypothetical protein|uniref:Uncharacterized protein n=1 Tax=Mycobacterium rhizamassiliense TaxID=1841860 RepID=A0A2U3NP17_9MYCO|nr:DUF5995 family protein [Mycobacterium rhizamassiliense]SPM33204.1 hypothetical protein MRAB57_1007 [Mycobacterium rhizamassiliense]